MYRWSGTRRLAGEAEQAHDVSVESPLPLVVRVCYGGGRDRTKVQRGCVSTRRDSSRGWIPSSIAVRAFSGATVTCLEAASSGTSGRIHTWARSVSENYNGMVVLVIWLQFCCRYIVIFS